MSEELALNELIEEDKKNQKKNDKNSNNNKGFKRNYNNNNNNGNKFIKKTNYKSNNLNNNNNNNNRNNNYRNNKEDNYDRNDNKDRYQQVKKIQKPISKGRKDDNHNDSHQGSDSQNTKRPQVLNAGKKVTIPKKLYTVKVKNLPSSINSHEIYELASDKEQVKVDSITTTFNCNSDSKLIEAEISYYTFADAKTFVENYHEASLENQELQVFLVN